jgi:hypothetical protein
LILNCVRLPQTEPKVNDGQKQNERYPQMRWGHRTCSINHFHNTGSHIWILANATARNFHTKDSIHFTRARSIQMIDVANGTAELPGDFLKTDRKANEQDLQCHRAHRRFDHSLAKS